MSETLPLDTESLYQLYRAHPLVETDTRRPVPGGLFFALKGPRFDGNRFAEQSLDQGAAYAVIDDPALKTDPRMILVDDVLGALQALARHHRDQLHIPVIAITGSNGKTTTKELTRAVLSRKYTAYATEGNLNNHIGVPLTLLKIRPETRIAVIEMGANHQGEIASYCRIARPTHGIITNVGKAHLEGFGGPEGVKKGKGELFDHLRAEGGTAFACADFEYFRGMSRGIREVVWYGTAPEEAFRGEVIRSHPYLELHSSFAGLLRTRLAGAFNIYNVLAALSIGAYFGVEPGEAAAAVEAYTPDNARSQLVSLGSNTVILDAYNANPSSMQAAIEHFAGSPAADKVLMLGAMMELGPESVAEHEKLLRLVGRYSWKKVVLVGGDFAKVSLPDGVLYFPDAEAAAGWLQAQSFAGAEILVKGSRSVGMEKVLL